VRFAPAPTRRLPGIGPKTAERLAELGHVTVGQLQQADEAKLATRFGTNTARFLKARALFEDDSPVETERAVAKSVSNERTFDTDIDDLARLEDVLREMSRELCEGLQRRGRRGRTIAIKVRLDDWTTVTRARTIEERTNDADVVLPVAVEGTPFDSFAGLLVLVESLVEAVFQRVGPAGLDRMHQWEESVLIHRAVRAGPDVPCADPDREG
jgi:DNA polymerase-4